MSIIFQLIVYNQNTYTIVYYSYVHFNRCVVVINFSFLLDITQSCSRLCWMNVMITDMQKIIFKNTKIYYSHSNTSPKSGHKQHVINTWLEDI
jgi:hypothetical protein